MNLIRMRNLITLLLSGSLGGMLLADSAHAAGSVEHAPDPMRPSGLPPSRLPAGGVEAGLQTVVIGPKGRSMAVVNGNHLKVGEHFGQQTVVAITESEVRLAGKNRTEVLSATPAARKVVRPRPAAKPVAPGGKDSSAR